MTVQNNEQWVSLIDSFQSAALGARTWDQALQGLAAATGSQSAQLIVRKGDLSVLFNVMTDVDPTLMRLTEDLQPINPRPRIVMGASLLEPLADWDVISPEESRRNAFYVDVLKPWDRPFFCATVLERQEDAFITLGVMRSQADGYIDDRQRRTFSMLAPHMRAAIRLYGVLERNGAAVVTGAMEAIAVPLIVCDRTGRVRALTQAAEALVGSGSGLEIKEGKLRTARAEQTRALQDAIEAALPDRCEPGRPAGRTVVIHAQAPTAAPIVLDVFPLPMQTGILNLASLEPQVLIVACGQRRAEARRAAILAAVYGLTTAETEIAQQLAAGQSAQAIASGRGVAVGTVRTQIKTILAKLGVRRQTELAARLHQL